MSVCNNIKLHIKCMTSEKHDDNVSLNQPNGAFEKSKIWPHENRIVNIV